MGSVLLRTRREPRSHWRLLRGELLVPQSLMPTTIPAPFRALKGRGVSALVLLVSLVVLFAGAPIGVAAPLPDGRSYEFASPGADKDVMADSGRTRAASSEVAGLPMAAVFSSLGGFGDVRGAGVATDYFAARTGEPG